MKKFTKEELMNTYIVNDHGKLREKYVNACLEAGYGHQQGYDGSIAWYSLDYLSVNLKWVDRNHWGFVGQCMVIKHLAVKQLTLADFKGEVSENLPCNDKGITSQWKYELIGDTSIFDLHKDLKAGNLYFQDHNQGNSNGMVQITDEGTLITLFADRTTICRKVEVKWQDEVESYLLTCDSGIGMLDIVYGNGNELGLSDEDFLEAARIALRGVGELK